MVKIRMLTSISGAYFCHGPGDEVEMEEGEAVRLLNARYAEPIAVGRTGGQQGAEQLQRASIPQDDLETATQATPSSGPPARRRRRATTSGV
jgi:hypothetical protein